MSNPEYVSQETRMNMRREAFQRAAAKLAQATTLAKKIRAKREMKAALEYGCGLREAAMNHNADDDTLAIAMGDATLTLRSIEARIFTLLQPMVRVGLALVHQDDWTRLQTLYHERALAAESEHKSRRAYMSALMRQKDEP